MHLCKSIVQIIERPRHDWNDCHPQCSCRAVSLLEQAFLAWIKRPEDGDALRVGNSDVQKFKGLSSRVETLSGQPCDVAAWFCKRFHDPQADRVATCRHHYRDRRRCPLERQRCTISGTHNHIRCKRDKLTGKTWYTGVIVISPSYIEAEISPLNIA